MRNYTKKAKIKDSNDWVIGYHVYVDYFGKHYILVSEKTHNGLYGMLSMKQYEIEKDTICEPIGITDKKGNMIWENDILMSGEPYIPTIPFSVRFNCKTLAYVGFYDEYNKEFPLNADLLSSCEVIGNIFNNKTK